MPLRFYIQFHTFYYFSSGVVKYDCEICKKERDLDVSFISTEYLNIHKVTEHFGQSLISIANSSDCNSEYHIQVSQD